MIKDLVCQIPLKVTVEVVDYFEQRFYLCLADIALLLFPFVFLLIS